MEVRCPSCGARHKTEDYPGAFDILCGCGYLILNPEIDDKNVQSSDINFEGPPAVEEVGMLGVDIDQALAGGENSLPDFSSQEMTPPEELPEGMLYDPMEVPKQDYPAPASPKLVSDEAAGNVGTAAPAAVSSGELIQRVQKGSMGQVLGPDYDLEILSLPPDAKHKARERVEKFLQDQKWLKEEMDRRSFILNELFNSEKVKRIPEALAVEIYIAALENGAKCRFMRHAA